jgi:hypothetical protein
MSSSLTFFVMNTWALESALQKVVAYEAGDGDELD